VVIWVGEHSYLTIFHLYECTGRSFSISKVFDIERFGREHRMPLDYGPATLEMLLNDAIVQKSLEKFETVDRTTIGDNFDQQKTWWKRRSDKITRSLGRTLDSFRIREPNPFHSQLLQTSNAIEDLDAELSQSGGGPLEKMNDMFIGGDAEAGKGSKTLAMEREVALAAQRKRRAQEEYLLKHPNYDKSLYMFSRYNGLRKFCQALVPPGRGERVLWVKPHVPFSFLNPTTAFEAFIELTIIAMLVVMCVTTPLYQQASFPDYPSHSWNWLSYTNLAFGLIFTTEALIRIIADGLFWTPNTYWLGLMGLVDCVVIVAIWVDLIESQVSHQIPNLAAIKALRAIRLCYLIKPLRSLIGAVLGKISGLLMVS
jgi:hypothetical protein